ncbi:hypothetical protein PR001_g19701 [Phytophthora rubi]|uniref:Reverse transcriptase domain-containing protein n=1 Tax=Phytophthora rubi TaxID=129364 RepID=A0A6A3JTA3_9STRA|nr:hypothetical protein PR001_g19701 [Phytophthora rubi]
MELETIINKLGLVDAGFYNMPQGMRQSDITKYANEHHTHRHKAADGSIGTSRLDRWYIGATAKRLLRGVVTEESPCNADHRAVLLELHAPSGCTRMRKRAKIYPAPNYVQAATHSMITLKLKELQNEALKWRRGEAATKWDAFKQTIKEAMTHLKKAARARMNNGFRQKIQRVKQKLGKCDYGSQAENEKRRDLLDTLHKLQEERRVLRRRNLIEQNAWSSKKTTRHFFKRICTKFGDNVIPKLTQSATGPQRGVHEKANILADSWEPIFNGASAVDESIEEYVGRLHSRWKTIDLSDIDEAITEDEVAAAINKSKRGKACGPDDLGNEWYQDHCDNVVPILTKLYNESMEGEQIPTTFVEAFIFSITKGGDTSNPLNYRPIALLNTDYKILTRILAWRVRKHITKIVHSTQCGFVPGRTIHEAIDMLEAIKLRCREGKTLSKAQVLLLDFAKAYDSLDRAFLLEVLRRKGFPPKFCRLVEAIHTDTSVRFMANGELSRSVQVTRGIRQGCPLAPLLFIIAVDLLYDEIEMTHDIVGIKMDDRGEVSEIRAAGYADDTAIYIQHIRMQGAAIQAVARFSAVSGLNLNVKKSVAINLGCSSTTAEKEDASSVQTETEVMARDSTRYLGHVAGAGNTTEEAWSKALGALRVRLALAETKTNTPAQRAAIAAAIVIPKLLFVARHAWPTDTIVKKADKCIKNFVWRSYFAEPEGAVSGWVKGVKDWESQI